MGVGAVADASATRPAARATDADARTTSASTAAARTLASVIRSPSLRNPLSGLQDSNPQKLQTSVTDEANGRSPEELPGEPTGGAASIDARERDQRPRRVWTRRSPGGVASAGPTRVAPRRPAWAITSDVRPGPEPGRAYSHSASRTRRLSINRRNTKGHGERQVLADPTQKREHHARRNTTRADPIPHGARERLDGRDPLAGRGRTARLPRRSAHGRAGLSTARGPISGVPLT